MVWAIAMSYAWVGPGHGTPPGQAGTKWRADLFAYARMTGIHATSTRHSGRITRPPVLYHYWLRKCRNYQIQFICTSTKHSELCKEF
jgi:hypothetical protein